MTLTPGYGETPASDDELAWLHPDIRDLLGEPVNKAAIYDLEQALQADATEQLLSRVLGGSLPLDELLSDHFIRPLHKKLYGDIWAWAGLFRKLELNIGVAPTQIAVDLRSSLDTIRWRWEQTDDWSPRVLGIAASIATSSSCASTTHTAIHAPLPRSSPCGRSATRLANPHDLWHD